MAQLFRHEKEAMLQENHPSEIEQVMNQPLFVNKYVI